MTSPSTQPAASFPRDRRGQVLSDRYRLEAPIGVGGMATIWRAVHMTIDRPVAVKFLDIGGRDPALVRERFLREAKVAASVRHRNVADIIDFGTADDGQHYMVMELLEGVSLAAHLARRPASVHEAVRVVARILSGLGAVHDAGIVHRDLKPENIFLAEDADGAVPKLLDFGVSKSLQAERESVIPTHENLIAGTPEYMAPEQARGLPDIDHRADIYAVGVMLYEMLGNKLPFDGPNPGDLLVQAVTQDPIPLESLRPDLGAALIGVVERAMRKAPEERFQSAREMRQALLAAAARTASEIASGGRERRRSDYPTVDPAALMTAVGAAYEPGDSEVVHISGDSLFPEQREHRVTESLDEGEDVRAGPPPPLRDLRTEEAPSLGSLPTQEAPHGMGHMPTEEGPPAAARLDPGLRRRSQRRLAVGAGLAVLLVVAAGVVALSGGDPEPTVEGAAGEAAPDEELIAVTLSGVPAGSEVTVDGSRHDGTEILLTRDETEHLIQVTAPGRAPWTTRHRAVDGAIYVVEMPEIGGDEASTSGAASGSTSMHRRGSTGSMRGPATGSAMTGDLLRDPGF